MQATKGLGACVNSVYQALFPSGLFLMYCSLEYIIFTSCNLPPSRCVMLYCDVGWCIKGSAVHSSCQQCLIAKQLGLSVTVRIRARVRECEFPFFFSSYFGLC